MVDLPTVCWVVGPEVELVAITTGSLIVLRFQELILTLENINQVVKTALHVSGLGPIPAVINQDSAVLLFRPLQFLANAPNTMMAALVRYSSIPPDSQAQLFLSLLRPSFISMQAALEKLVVNGVLFRTQPHRHFSAPNLLDVNRSQEFAVKHALDRPLSLFLAQISAVTSRISLYSDGNITDHG
jgi:hypothetical protein